jgi:hypothetical protein
MPQGEHKDKDEDEDETLTHTYTRFSPPESKETSKNRRGKRECE